MDTNLEKRIEDAKTVAVHDGKFHADDAFAVAALKFINPQLVVIRTRDAEQLGKADIRADVGGKYNPATGDYDHHQPDAPKRENGIPYAAFGLIWKHYGAKICEKVLEKFEDKGDLSKIVQAVEVTLTQKIDSCDTGHYDPDEACEDGPYMHSRLFSALNPSWLEPNADSVMFDVATDIAKQILSREIIKAHGKVLAYDSVITALDNSAGKGYFVLDKNCPWHETVIEYSPNMKYLVHKDINGKQWRVTCVPVELGKFVYRKKLPVEWAGLNGDDLRKITGVDDAIFCHKARFTAGASSFEGAVKLAELALKYEE